MISYNIYRDLYVLYICINDTSIHLKMIRRIFPVEGTSKTRTQTNWRTRSIGSPLAMLATLRQCAGINCYCKAKARTVMTMIATKNTVQQAVTFTMTSLKSCRILIPYHRSRTFIPLHPNAANHVQTSNPLCEVTFAQYHAWSSRRQMTPLQPALGRQNRSHEVWCWPLEI